MFKIIRLKFSPFLTDMFITTITSILTMLSFILIARILASSLGPEKFGAYSLSRRILSTIEPLATLNMGIAITRYVAISKNRQDRSTYLFNGLFLTMASSILILICALIFRIPLTNLLFQDQKYLSLFIATFILVFSYSCFVVLYGFYRGSGRMWEANLWQLALIAIAPLVIAILYSRSGRVDLIIFLTSLCFFAVFFPLMLHGLKVFFSHEVHFIKIAQLKEIIHYGFPRIPGSLANAGILSIATFLSPYFGTLKDAGYLMAGISVLRIIEGGVDSFGRVVLPKAAQYLFSLEHRKFLKEKIIDLIGFVFHLGLFICLHLILWADQIVVIWLGNQYVDVIPLLKLISLAIIPYLIYSMLRSVVDAVEVKAINARNLYISLGITTLVCFILGKMGFGAVGLVTGTVIGIAVLGLLTFHYLCVFFQIRSLELVLKECFILNIIFVLVGFFLKRVIVAKSVGFVLVGSAMLLESSLLFMYCFILYKLNTRWLMEIKRRISFGNTP